MVSPSSSSSSSLSPFGNVKKAIKSANCEHMVAGLSGGVVSTIVLHPLDLLKIRFAVDDGKDIKTPKYLGLRNAVTSIFKQEGIRGFYKGLSPNIAGAGASWGLYFFFYSKIKSGKQNGDSKIKLSPGTLMLSAAQAGALTLSITNPIWVVKTRLCLQIENSRSGLAPSQQTYRGIMDTFYKITATEGIRGLYKGFIPGLFGVSHGAIQFMIYEELNSSYNTYYNQPIDTKLGTSEYLVFSALSKTIAALLTYPYQVVRTRLQKQNSHYKGSVDCIIKTFRNEGWKGFYKGIVPNLIRVVPATAITFVIYEKISHILK